ncbi:MAG: D-2-hydroxyacid dehydrogenase [Dehalococcoidia bacterium]|nr:D-2-hydroxyacid dehydrogenase [Dehalococcoidia bacterium]
MERIKVVILGPASAADLERIAAVDPRILVLDGRGKFDSEYLRTWPPETARLHPGNRAKEVVDDDQYCAQQMDRDALLGSADVACIGFPFPNLLISRAPRLKWVHQLPAGVSNLRFGDIWGCSVPVTSSRGYRNSTAHAEWVLATILMFAKDLPRSIADKQAGAYDRRLYRLRSVAGKTVGIVGLGGIGREVARLARALGMRTVGTRRSITSRLADAEGVDLLLPPSDLSHLLAEADFVVIAAQSTPETNGMIGRAEIGVMKPTSYLINVARGEIVDESALIEALNEGTIAGAALDVREAEFERPPSQEFLSAPNLFFAPHISGGTDLPPNSGIELFCQNLERFLAGEDLVNRVDWERGY